MTEEAVYRGLMGDDDVAFLGGAPRPACVARNGRVDPVDDLQPRR